MWRWRLKNTLSIVLALLLAVLVLGVLAIGGVDKFSKYGGNRVFYLDSQSSQSLQKKHLSVLEIFRVRGESVYLDGESENFVEGVLSDFAAQVLFEEEIDGVRSYYCFSPTLGEGIMVNGRKVNLHIAISDGGCALGSPIIFGGF